MSYNGGVRRGSLASVSEDVVNMNPECLAGLCGQAGSPRKRPARLPSQGPAPLSAWGFAFGGWFLCGAQELSGGPKRRLGLLPWLKLRVGRKQELPEKSFSEHGSIPWRYTKTIPDRTPSDISAPEWVARKRTQAAGTLRASLRSVGAATARSHP